MEEGYDQYEEEYAMDTHWDEEDEAMATQAHLMTQQQIQRQAAPSGSANAAGNSALPVSASMTQQQQQQAQTPAVPFTNQAPVIQHQEQQQQQQLQQQQQQHQQLQQQHQPNPTLMQEPTSVVASAPKFKELVWDGSFEKENAEAEKAREAVVARRTKRAVHGNSLVPGVSNASGQSRVYGCKIFYQPSGSNVQSEVSVSLESGRSVYFREKSEAKLAKESDWRKAQAELLSGAEYQKLAGETTELLSEIRKQNAEVKLTQEQREWANDLNGFDDVNIEDVNIDGNNGVGNSSQQSTSNSPRNKIIDTGLLATKYAPTSFVDLVSGERTNRDVLGWVKEWDNFVFGAKSTNPKKNRDNLDEKPEDPRPEYKILLLAGPPGTGKTTLAQIIAHHAGYRPVLVNASDERSAKAVEERVSSAMQMSSILKDTRPACLILDEVEGAANMGDGKGAISMLVRLAQTKLKPLSSGGLQLTRPLICVCNNAFAPVLRALRPCVKMVHFRSPTTARLSQRLGEICYSEKHIVRPGTLDLLCERLDHDIRSCLHALQFMVHKRTTLTPQMVDKYCSHAKDKTADLMTAWQAVFYNKAKAGAYNTVLSRKQSASGVNDPRRLPHRVQALSGELSKFFSESTKLLEGIHENVLGLKSSDSLLANTAKTLDWIATAHEFSTFATSKQQWELNWYFPWLGGVSVHLLCAGSSRPKLTFPRQQAEAHQLTLANTEVLGDVARKMSIRRGLQTHVSDISVDILSPLLAVVKPTNVRALPQALLSTGEQYLVSHAADVMEDCGLEYKLGTREKKWVKNEWSNRNKGNYGGGGSSGGWNSNQRWEELLLSPAIDTMVCGEEAATCKEAVCSAIIHQQDITKAHRTRERNLEAYGDIPTNVRSVLTRKPSKKDKCKKGEEEKKVVETSAVDFFGRKVESKTSRHRVQAHAPGVDGDCQNEASAMEDEEDMQESKKRRLHVVFRFNEGFTNAVKRTVKLDELL